MRRLSAWLIGPLMLTTTALAAGPAAAATPRSAVPSVKGAGQYTAFAAWGVNGYKSFSLTLNSDHTGTDHFNDTIVWSLSGKSLTMTFDDGLWTYLGTKSKAGFNNRAHPGTLSNINGGTGTWYAVRLP